jgi:mRNA-degrading endonuclease RelE of RelBE toxin-antitoxin system
LPWSPAYTPTFRKDYKNLAGRINKGGWRNQDILNSDDSRSLGRPKLGKWHGAYGYDVGRAIRVLYSVDSREAASPSYVAALIRYTSCWKPSGDQSSPPSPEAQGVNEMPGGGATNPTRGDSSPFSLGNPTELLDESEQTNQTTDR